MAKLVIVVDEEMLVDLEVESIVIMPSGSADDMLHWYVEDIDFDELVYDAMLSGLSTEVEQ